MCVMSLVKSRSCLLYSLRLAAIAELISDHHALCFVAQPRPSTSLPRSTAAKAASRPPSPSPSRCGRRKPSSEAAEKATSSRQAAVLRPDSRPSCRSRNHRTFPSCPSSLSVPNRPSSSCSKFCPSPFPPSPPSSSAQLSFPRASSSESTSTPRPSPASYGRSTRKDRVGRGAARARRCRS